MAERGPTERELEEGYPATVTFRFRSERAKRYFLSGLCDGWGENACSMRWPWPEKTFHKVDAFGIDVFGDDETTYIDDPSEPESEG